eukprot:7955752-Karenia_brevis.AAC.1
MLHADGTCVACGAAAGDVFGRYSSCPVFWGLLASQLPEASWALPVCGAQFWASDDPCRGQATWAILSKGHLGLQPLEDSRT